MFGTAGKQSRAGAVMDRRNALLMLLAAAAAAWLPVKALAAQEELQVGHEAPDFELPDLQDGVFHLEAQRGRFKALILLFWGVWCPYCREIMVRLKKAYPQLSEQGLQVVAVSMRESPHKVGLFADKLDPGFPVLVDEWAELKDSYLIRDVPRIVILDSELTVRATRITTSAKAMEAMIRNAME